MKKIGAIKIIALLIAKVIVITLIIILIQQTYAKELTPEVITTTFQEVDPTDMDKIDRFYEISERSLEIGYNVTLDAPSAFQTTIGNRNRYIIVNDFSQDSINLAFIGSGETLFNQQLETSNYVIFKIDDLNLQFILHSINGTHAQVELKLFREKIPTDVDYFELFDIQVRLAEHEIYTPSSLSAIIEFTNFGEGPSHIRLIYSIINTTGYEFYIGIDEKIVETDQVMIKNFKTLDIPYGKYIIRTTIYYGDSQEATSEQFFTLKPIPKYQLIKQPALFIAIILTTFTIITLLRKRQKKLRLNQQL